MTAQLLSTLDPSHSLPARVPFAALREGTPPEGLYRASTRVGGVIAAAVARAEAPPEMTSIQGLDSNGRSIQGLDYNGRHGLPGGSQAVFILFFSYGRGGQ